MKNKTNKVTVFLEASTHPRKEEINRVREIILGVDERIEEAIKWKSPTFMYKGNIASVFMNAKKHVSLMFHKGVLLDNHGGLLTGSGKETRTAKFQNMENINERKKDLEGLIKQWIKLQGSL